MNLRRKEKEELLNFIQRTIHKDTLIFGQQNKKREEEASMSDLLSWNEHQHQTNKHRKQRHSKTQNKIPIAASWDSKLSKKAFLKAGLFERLENQIKRDNNEFSTETRDSYRTRWKEQQWVEWMMSLDRDQMFDLIKKQAKPHNRNIDDFRKSILKRKGMQFENQRPVQSKPDTFVQLKKEIQQQTDYVKLKSNHHFEKTGEEELIAELCRKEINRKSNLTKQKIRAIQILKELRPSFFEQSEVDHQYQEADIIQSLTPQEIDYLSNNLDTEFPEHSQLKNHPIPPSHSSTNPKIQKENKPQKTNSHHRKFCF